ncbi:DedA family protein [Kitasatospora phosalacinea]|uniref:DedA family protein n=1 Tax=Kitasatospora phosalacinea TaxID=2065 RepID=UPI0009E04771|nr:DedA family protein [Kitasatospora phosalacinea]
MKSVTDWLGGLSGPVVYAVVAALVFAEDALFFGFVLPGETAAVLGGVLAHQGSVSLGWMLVAVVGAAVLGDTIGYEVGLRLGPRVLETKSMRRHAQRIGRAQELIRRRGPAAVLLGRFVAFFRALMPALAGVSKMPYRKFLLFNAVGGLLWGVGCVLLGYFAGAAYSKVEGTVGRTLALVVVGVVLLAVLVHRFRGRREDGSGERRDSEEGHAAAEGPGEPEGRGAHRAD